MNKVSFWDAESILNCLWWWLCNSMNILKTIEWYVLNRWIVMVYTLYFNTAFIKKKKTKLNLASTTQLSNCTLGHWFHRKESLCSHNTCTQMLTEALLIIAKTWKQPRWTLISEWLNKLWYNHTVENDSAIKRNKLLVYTITWRKLRRTTLREKSKSQRLHTRWVYLYNILAVKL